MKVLDPQVTTLNYATSVNEKPGISISGFNNRDLEFKLLLRIFFIASIFVVMRDPSPDLLQRRTV